MIRIERNTDNLFSLLQFIAFVINTLSFNRRFYSKRLTRKCKTTQRREVRGFELATLQLRWRNPLYQFTLAVQYSYIDITLYTSQNTLRSQRWRCRILP